MSKSKKYHTKNTYWNENDNFKNKYKSLKKTIKDNVYENAALCDEIAHTQEKLLIVREECKFLAKKLKQFEPQFGVPKVQKVETAPVKATRKKVEKKIETKIDKKLDKKIDKKLDKKIVNINGLIKPVKRPVPRQKKSLRASVQEPTTGGNVIIYNFGDIVYDSPHYYTDSAIYPGGYYATRTYAHFRNIYSKCTYHCKVIKTGSSPRFEIMDNDKHFKVTGLSTDECHSHLVSLINKMLGADDLIPSNRNGDRFFGLSIPKVRLKLQAKPESKLCKGYIPIKSQFDNYELELKAENDPSVSFEGLHACINKFRSRH